MIVEWMGRKEEENVGYLGLHSTFVCIAAWASGVCFGENTCYERHRMCIST